MNALIVKYFLYSGVMQVSSLVYDDLCYFKFSFRCNASIYSLQSKWLPLHTLAASGDFYLLDSLLKHNVDINALDKVIATA